MAADLLWYFGYGSNMCRETFIERRKMAPQRVQVARLRGYRLCFDIPVGPGERGVANLLTEPAAEVWGVAYAITAEDFERLDNSEGVPAGVYKRIPVDLATVEEQRLTGFTYQSALRAPGRKPSARYLGLLLAGARENGLPADYLRYLEQIDPGHDERRG